MKTILKLTAAAAALAGLTACDALGLGGNQNAGGNGSAVESNNAVADANGSAGVGGKDPAAGNATAASAPFTGQVTAAFLVGRWTDNNDCNNTIEFKQDGTFTVPGGGGGIWALDGDRLTFQGAGSRSARVQAPSEDAITLIHEDGSLGRSTRCTN